MYSESVAAKLKKAREKTGLSQRDVAKELKISQPSIALYETGKRQPDLELLAVLCDFYEVSADWILGTQGNNKPLQKETKKENRRAV